MATGGTGDLLTGMIAVYLHGTAGDLAEADEGEVALLPSDIADRLGDAVLELTARKRVKREAQ
jgi:NAD(P)H-hydrate repair Nnr-like enzyme with NAD(P)H-hydrate dehydratase domain